MLILQFPFTDMESISPRSSDSLWGTMVLRNQNLDVRCVHCGWDVTIFRLLVDKTQEK